MSVKECLEHPGCIWSCPCDCLNCMSFETVLREESRADVAYSSAAASFSRDGDLGSSSSCDGRVFSETFYDTLLSPSEIQEKKAPGQVRESQMASARPQMASARPQAHDAKKPGG